MRPRLLTLKTKEKVAQTLEGLDGYVKEESVSIIVEKTLQGTKK